MNGWIWWIVIGGFITLFTGAWLVYRRKNRLLRIVKDAIGKDPHESITRNVEDLDRYQEESSADKVSRASNENTNDSAMYPKFFKFIGRGKDSN